MEDARSPLLFGPAGWQPEPSSARPSLHPLERLAADYDAVEIDSARTVFLRPEVVRVWARKVAKNRAFQFSVALHRTFTEERDLDRELVRRYTESVVPLASAGKLGCVLMRFPWSFRFTEENRDFFIRLRRTFSMFPLVAEMKHSSWLRDEAIGTFLDFHVGFANIDQPLTVSAMPPTNFLTSAVGYVRLTREHRDAQGNVYPAYSDEHALDWKDRIEKVSRFSKRTMVIAALSSPRASARLSARMEALCSPTKPAHNVFRQPTLFSVA